jgi:hypothetical protein
MQPLPKESEKRIKLVRARHEVKIRSEVLNWRSESTRSRPPRLTTQQQSELQALLVNMSVELGETEGRERFSSTPDPALFEADMELLLMVVAGEARDRWESLTSDFHLEPSTDPEDDGPNCDVFHRVRELLRSPFDNLILQAWSAHEQRLHVGGVVSATDEPHPTEPRSATAANLGNATNRRGAEIILDSAPLPLADRTEIEQTLQQWRYGIQIDVNLLMKWSGWLESNTPPEAMKCFQTVDRELIKDSLLRLAFDWEGSGEEILSYDHITATLLKNLQKALKRYVHLAIDLVSGKWADRSIHPSAYASRMKSAGDALDRDVSQMLSDGGSALAGGASTDSLGQALSDEIEAGIAREIDNYRRNAQLTGLSDLPERGDVGAERATNDGVIPRADRSAADQPSGLGAGTLRPPNAAVAMTGEDEMIRKLPPTSAERIRAKLYASDTFLTDRIKWLPTELENGAKTKQEVEAILCKESRLWAWEIFVTILREWAETGIPPEDFEAIATEQIESISTHAEERCAGFVSTFQISAGEVFRTVHAFLPGLIAPYREENRFRFQCLAVAPAKVLDHIEEHIEAGTRLERALANMAASWQVDENGCYPKSITGEAHPFGDLEIDVRRWFNLAEQYTRDGLTHGDDRHQLEWGLAFLCKPENDETKAQYCERIERTMESAVKILMAHVLPAKTIKAVQEPTVAQPAASIVVRENAARPRKRGRPIQIPYERKQQALEIQGNAARARILYATRYPSPQQVKNVSSILKHYLGKNKPTG